MVPDLTESDKEKFEEYKEKLADVKRAPPSTRDQVTEFTPFDPMLAEPFSGDLSALDEEEWIAERKFDGTRIILEKFDGEVRLYTRRHVERSAALPAITAAATDALPDGLVLDGEAAYVDDDHNTYFVPIHGSDETVRKKNLEERLFVFDILVEGTDWVGNEPLMDRKDRIDAIVPGDGILQLEAYVESDFAGFFDQVVDRGEEGIILKRRTSLYRPGTRSSNWRKVKHFKEIDAIVVGYTPGEGARADTFGALVLSDGEQFIGKVGSGFTEAELETVRESFEDADESPIDRSAVEDSFTPVEPFVVSVKFQELTDDDHLRAPVYLARHPDKPPEQVQPLREQVPDR